jgi:Lrp/AsnC family transcriptional regulator, regulator for asnA, asnC and gidA
MRDRDIDDVDLELVRQLLSAPRATYAELSRATGVSETTVKRRVEALFDARIITPAVIPDVRRLGFEAMALIGLKVDLTHLYEVAETIRDLPQVTSLHLTMGRYDIMVTVAVPTTSDLTTFLVEKVAPLPGIRDTESFVSTRALKLLRDWRLPDDGALITSEQGSPNGTTTSE